MQHKLRKPQQTETKLNIQKYK